MTNIGFINLTYTSPQEDIIKCTSYNSDGSININLTLCSYKQLLESNISTIDSLIDMSQDISDIQYTGYDVIAITTNTESTINQLLEKKAIITSIPLNESDEDSSIDETIFNNNQETNAARFEPIINLTRQQNIPIVGSMAEEPEYSSEIENSSSQEYIFQNQSSIDSIINKYMELQKSITKSPDMKRYGLFYDASNDDSIDQDSSSDNHYNRG